MQAAWQPLPAAHDNRPPQAENVVHSSPIGRDAMRYIPAAVLALVLCFIAPSFGEEQSESLNGEFYVMPADPDAGSPPTVYMTVTGEAAKAVYEGLDRP